MASPDIDLEKLRRWIADCDPLKSIDPTEDKEIYSDLETVTIKGEVIRLRGTDQIFQGLARAIELGETGTCQLFSGFSGTGKSTELRGLAHRLEEAGFVTLITDARKYHDLSRELTIEDLLVINAGAFGEETAARLGREDILEESYWKRLQHFVNQEAELKEIKIPLLGIGDLKFGVKHAKPFWKKVRDMLEISVDRLRDDCHSFISECVKRLEKAEHGKRGVVFIFDNLERLNTPTGQFREVMGSVVRVLAEYPEYLRLPNCHTIYTVPPYVQMLNPGLRGYYRMTHVLPAIRVTEPGLPLRSWEPGTQALAELVGRRIPLEEVFGERRDLLERLILYSGGHVRTLIHIIRELLYHVPDTGLPPTEDAVDLVIRSFREPARMRVFRESLGLLNRILKSGTLDDLSADDHADLARLMDDQVVLCYRNGDGMFEVHPLVREHVHKLATKMEMEMEPEV